MRHEEHGLWRHLNPFGVDNGERKDIRQMLVKTLIVSAQAHESFTEGMLSITEIDSLFVELNPFLEFLSSPRCSAIHRCDLRLQIDCQCLLCQFAITDCEIELAQVSFPA